MELKPYEVIALMKLELQMLSPDINRLAAFVELLKSARAREAMRDHREAA